MRIIVVSDIHGRADILKRILSLCSITARNGYEVIFQLQQH